MMNWDIVIKNITAEIEDWVKERITDNLPVISYITEYYIKKEHTDEKIQKLFQDVESENTKTSTIEILKPRSVDDFIWEKRNDAKIDTPVLIVSLEEVIPTKEELATQYHEEFVLQLKKPLVNTYILRFEMFSSIKRFLYTLENNEFRFKEELPSDGKKFFPYFN